MKVVKESFKEMKLELSTEGQNKISHVKAVERHFQQREQNVQRGIEERQLGTLLTAKQIAWKGWGEGKLVR